MSDKIYYCFLAYYCFMWSNYFSYSSIVLSLIELVISNWLIYACSLPLRVSFYLRVSLHKSASIVTLCNSSIVRLLSVSLCKTSADIYCIFWFFYLMICYKVRYFSSHSLVLIILSIHSSCNFLLKKSVFRVNSSIFYDCFSIIYWCSIILCSRS